MQIYSFGRKGEKPVQLDTVSRLPDEGFIWLDFTRDEAAEWPAHVEPLVEASIHDNHVQNSFSSSHPSYFDVTEDYDLLIFQGLTPEACGGSDHLIVTKSAAFFIFDRLLVSVHADENLSFDIVKRKFCESKLRFPSTPVGLVYSIIDTMVDRYLTITDQLEKRMEKVESELLDPKNRFDDWRELLNYRKQAHELEILCEQNLDALDAWRRDMRVEISEKQRSRLNDLREHIQRVEAHADSVQKDIEAAVQMYFASLSHQTNEIMKIFTVVSVVFMPMMLLTSIWGMNFEFMPELHWRYAYFVGLGLMVGVGALCWLYFKRRGFL